MSKKSLFISATLTTFVLVILASVVNVYAKFNNSTATTDANQLASQPTAAVATVTDEPAATSQPTQVSYLEAATAASNFLGQTDMYSVESALFNGVEAYKVVFTSGYIVYVGMDGQILSSQAPQPVVVVDPVVTPKSKKHTNQSTANSSHPAESDEHESDDHD